MTPLETTHNEVGLLAIGDAYVNPQNLHALGAALPAPLHQWFNHPHHKILALAMAAAIAGEIEPDQAAAMDYLASLDLETAQRTIKGQVIFTRVGESTGGYCFSAIRAATMLGEAAESRTGGRVTYGNSTTVIVLLKSLTNRARTIDKLSESLKSLNTAGATGSVGNIVAELVNGLRNWSDDISEQPMGASLISEVQLCEREAERRLSGTERPCTWGIPSLDKEMPLRAGRLYILGGRPGGGKTSLAIQAAYRTAKALGRRSVAIASIEMAAGELALTLACKSLRIPKKTAVEQWETLSELDKAELRAIAAQWTKEDAIWVRDATNAKNGQTVNDIIAWVRQQKAIHGKLELVIVDHLGLVKGSTARQSSLDRIVEITGALKQVAMSEQVAVVLLCQYTRDGRKASRTKEGQLEMDPVPRVEDLYGGSSIEADADGIILLHQIERTGDPRLIDAVIGKNRRGAEGTIPMWFYGSQQKFTECIPISQRAERLSSAPNESEEVF